MKHKLLLFLVLSLLSHFSLSINAQLRVTSTGDVTMSKHAAINGSNVTDTVALNIDISSVQGKRNYGVYSSSITSALNTTPSICRVGLVGEVLINHSLKGPNILPGKFCAGVAGISNVGVGVYGSSSSSIPLTWGLYHYAGYFNGDVKVVGTMTATTVTQTSDIRFKDNVSALGADYSFNVLSLLNPIRYTLRNDSNIFASQEEEDIRTHYGFSAQEVQKIMPELVYEDGAGNLSLNYTELIPLLVKAVNEQQKQIAELTQEVETLRNNSETPSHNNARKSSHNQAETEETILYQNTPNPFSISTEIAYKIPESAMKAEIIIYDMNGRQLEMYPIEQYGHGTVMVQAGSLSPGMYMYTLIMDNTVIDTKRMILTK